MPEPEILAARQRGGDALQAVFNHLDLPPISDEEVTEAVYANGSNDCIPRDVIEDLKGAQSVMDRGITGFDLILAPSGRYSTSSLVEGKVYAPD